MVLVARPWRAEAAGLSIVVRLTPKGGRDAIDGVEHLADGRAALKVRVRAAPSDGEANAALIRVIAKALRVPARQVSLVAGASACRWPAPRPLWQLPWKTCAPALRQTSRASPVAPQIIDGKAIAADLRGRVADAVHRLTRDRGIVPGLAVVLVGSNPASESYVGSKVKMTAGSGMRSFDHRLPASTSEADLLALVARLNADPSVNGILVQLPLSAQIDAQKVIAAIDPAKDVDGFHPVNAGRLAVGLPALAPCTPLGCVLLAKTVHASLQGLEAVVIGRSNIVGKPLAQLLLAENATVTVAHSKTHDLAAVCRRADILFAAVGRARMVRGDWIKPGATVIDVGINRITDESGSSRIVGDVAFAEACEFAGAITPVPGGVGPLTIACLLANTVRAACAQAGLAPPALGRQSSVDRE
jgi:methylenetetrahydrofolate dehydrogenase (NADP+) / methenyltetrahydrofolate cyclohydrolase